MVVRLVPVPEVRWRSDGGPTAAETRSYKADAILRGKCTDCHRRAATVKGKKRRKCRRCLKLDRGRAKRNRERIRDLLGTPNHNTGRSMTPSQIEARRALGLRT